MSSCRAQAVRPVAALQAMQGEIRRLTEEVKALLRKHDAQAGLIMTLEQRVSCTPGVWAWPRACGVAPPLGSPDCWQHLCSAVSLRWRPRLSLLPGRAMLHEGWWVPEAASRQRCNSWSCWVVPETAARSGMCCSGGAQTARHCWQVPARAAGEGCTALRCCGKPGLPLGCCMAHPMSAGRPAAASRQSCRPDTVYHCPEPSRADSRAEVPAGGAGG